VARLPPVFSHACSVLRSTIMQQFPENDKTQ